MVSEQWCEVVTWVNLNGPTSENSGTYFPILLQPLFLVTLHESTYSVRYMSNFLMLNLVDNSRVEELSVLQLPIKLVYYQVIWRIIPTLHRPAYFGT